ncbi:type IV secretory system conjugative DNA transfer family protein [Marinomonas mediterranea]|uniref:type IV secretory system conjugative DNA transfer family protein n=1 Tax=Marinomonas mediterranea TaxID=119864 RepID=UPI00234A6823|nr:type IV secretory system conjugative DNA transfer family protein [Marinomonas mediterranea]WCN09989.1 type IV secretory system conjugative DNA transfer family protein [Marinomonas mediterranea]
MSIETLLLYGLQGLLTIILLRTVVTWLGRIFGFYSPDHYYRWPTLPWRPVYRLYMKCRQWYEQVFLLGKRGATGGFASPLSQFCMRYKPNMLHLGRATAFGIGLLQPVGTPIFRHIFMLAMTGTGKTTALTSLIFLWRGSVFLIDPKAQIVRAISYHDKRTWWVFDPDGISGMSSISINFFDCINEAIQRDGDDAAVLWSTRIAEALIIIPSQSKQPYFLRVSKQFLGGLILHTLTHHPEEEQNLPFVRDLIINGYRIFDEDGQELTKDDEAHLLLLDSMSRNPAFDGVIAGAVSALKSAGKETAGNVRSSLQEQTQFLDLPNVRKVLRHSDISLADLKTRDDVVLAFTASIFSLREELSRLSRLLTNMVAYTFESVKEKKGQCLTVIDELPSQRYNPVFEVMLAVSRSMGQTFLGVSQNLELMKKHYPDSWKSFIGESDATFWMGGNHPDNAEFLSRLLGKTTHIKKDRYTGQQTRHEVSVMEAEQVSRYLNPNSNRLIVTLAGGRALKLRNEPYFKALPVWHYAVDPEHGERFWRKGLRAFVKHNAHLSHETTPTFPDVPSLNDTVISSTTKSDEEQE